jgi:exopolyphosphatase/guanosine-5'-triphosphate,3'-diphosphate pyrophosphatase
MSTQEISAMPPVVPGRADVLQAGVICAERALCRVGAGEVRISVSDLLDGIAIELGANAAGP